MATVLKPGERARNNLRPGLLAAAVALLSACGVTVERPGVEGREWMSKAEFRAYAERVFRRHNAAENDLMFLLPRLQRAEPERYGQLLDAEDAMLEACHPLAEVASQRGRGLDIGFFKRLRLPSDVADCERATVRVERLLAN